MIQLPIGAFPNKEQEKFQIRLNNVLCKVFACVVDQLLDKDCKHNPYYVSEYSVESDRRMRNKTLQIMRSAGALPMIVNLGGAYRATMGYNFETLFNAHSKDYMEPIVFPDVPNEISEFMEKDVIKGFCTNKEALTSIGYYAYHTLREGNKIYLYYNQDLYVTLPYTKSSRFRESMSIYPKALIDSRLKAVLRAVMRKYCEEDMLGFLKRKFDLDLDGQEQSRHSYDSDFSISLRNIAKYPVTFNQHCYSDAANSYAFEYAKLVPRINKEYERLKAFRDKLSAAGGTAAVLNEYIKESVDNLIAKGITLMNSEDDDDKESLEFILDHRDIISYDYLYN